MFSDGKRVFWLVLRIGVSVGLVVFLIWQQDLWQSLSARMVHILREWRWVVAGIACVFASTILAAVRWWLILVPVVPTVRLRFVVWTVFVALFFDLTSLGTVGGNAWRILSVSREHPGYAGSCAVSLLIDHVVGLFATILFCLAAGTIILVSSSEVGGPGSLVYQVTLGMLGTLPLAAAVVMSLSPAFVRRFGHWTPAALRPFVFGASERFGAILEQWPAALKATCVSLCMITLHLMIFYCGLMAVGGVVPLVPFLIIMLVVDLAATVPISVSGLGVREKTFESLMYVFATMASEVSVPASLLSWVFTLVGAMVGCILYVMGRRDNPG
jgi:uncharacterized membrane protein YbhN (UPF0104 family)